MFLMGYEKALRLQKLPPYIFSKIGQKKVELKKAGVDLIDLGMGDPDLSTPTPLVDVLVEKAKQGENHHYPPYAGIPEFKEAVSKWMLRRFNVEIDPETEAMNLIGTKEGVANFSQAILNPGDFCMIPDPGYPVYTNACVLSGATPTYYNLTELTQFKPKWSDIPDNAWKAAKLLFINFPNNPTGATVDMDCYRELADRAKKYNVIVCSDNPYSEQCYDTDAPSFLQAPGAKDVGIEFFSMSKTYNMTGWRIGFAVGNKDLIAALYQMKSTIDTGIFVPIQYAAIAALEGKDNELIGPSKDVFSYRRRFFTEELRKKGYEVFDAGATFYLWIRCPRGESSMDTCAKLMEEKGIVATPGVGFGKNGEGYFRISLTKPEERLKEALERMPTA
jgi:LL-diaminopimelate aminotransferase